MLPAARMFLCPVGSAEGLRWQPLSGIEKPGSGTESLNRGSCRTDLVFFLEASYVLCLRLGTAGGIRGRLRVTGFFCISLGAHRAAASPLRGIGKPDSG